VVSALRTVGLRRRFGAFCAVDGVSWEIPAGARQALIGPNGAGKTTLLNLLGGTLRPDAGQVLLAGEPITQLAPHARVRRGLARTFQVSSLFPGLTVLESVMLALCERAAGDRPRWRWLQAVSRRRAEIDRARQLLAQLHLDPDAARPTHELPYGKQRLLEIALALATAPRVLLLDEPAAGIPAGDSGPLFEMLERLPPEMTVLFVEHDMSLVFRFARRITVMADGQILAEGTPREIAEDRRVRQVYLGPEAARGHG
jgi:branched-chain amino acid transport system ATP-binding protein